MQRPSPRLQPRCGNNATSCVDVGRQDRGAFLSPEEPQDQRNDHADEDAGGKREEKSNIIPLDGDVARQPPQPWDLVGEQEQEARPDNDQSNNDQEFTDRSHRPRVLLLLPEQRVLYGGLRGRDAKMLIGRRGSYAAARGPLQKPLLEQERLLHILDRVPLLADRGGDRLHPDGAALEFFEDDAEDLPVH